MTAADRLDSAATCASGNAASNNATTTTCTQSWTYDLQGNVLTHTDRRGIVTTSHHDKENRLASQDRAGLTIQSITRDTQGNVVTQRDALQRDTTFTYDKANRKTAEQRSAMASESWTYTPLGDIASHTDADARTTTNTYTVRRFLESESLAGETTRYTVDGTGHRLTQQRPNGPQSTWTSTYDAAGNLRTVRDPLNHVTTYDHDANNNRVSVLDANHHATTFAYDARNRLRGKTYPGGANWQWRYDGDNNRIRSEAPNGRIAETTFDALNRPTLTSYLGAPATEVQSTAWTYDGNGNIRTVVDATTAGPRTETRDYDDFDRLTHAVDSDNRTVAYTYDDVGNRTHLIDHDGKDTVWTYDALNHNTRVFVPGIGTTVHTYTPAGLPDTITRADGALTEHTYLPNGRLQSLRHARNGTTLARYDYVYDPNGNRTEQREINGATTADTTQTTLYRYDDADRLTEVEEPNRTSTYTLDAVGNRTVEHVVDAGTASGGGGGSGSGSGSTISHSTLVYNDRDQLTSRSDPIANVSVTQTWDANGNLATQTLNGAAPRVYTYDARDRLIALTNPGAPGASTLTFAYHSNGLRREKSSATTTTRYQYDDQSPLAETNAIGNTLRQFHYSASQLIAQTQTGTTPTYRHYLLDALRSPIALLDLAGTVTARTSYDAFGEIRAQQGTTGSLVTPNRDAATAELPSIDNQPIGFTGYLKDPESGLYYAKARYYDPATARFTTEDPEAGKDLEPPSLHRYLYAYANPTVHYDPTGRIQELVAGADMIARWNQWLRNTANEQEPGSVGSAIAAGVGIGRGLLAITEGGLRTFNAAANLGVVGIDALDQATNDNYRGNPLADESAHELMGTGRAIRQFDQYLQDDGVFKSYDRAVETTSYAYEGKAAEVSDVTSALTTVAAPTKLATFDIGGTVNNARTFTRQLRAIEGDNGKTVFDSPEVVRDLEQGSSVRSNWADLKQGQSRKASDATNNSLGWPERGGSGPVPGAIGITDSSSTAALRNYYPKAGGIEFVFDPTTNRFAAGAPKRDLIDGSPHEQLVQSIGTARNSTDVVGGTFQRGSKGEFLTTENSGHYGQNWTNQNRAQFQQWLNNRVGLPVYHGPWRQE